MANKEAESKIDAVFNNYGSQSNKRIINLGSNVKLQRIDNSNGQGPQQIPSQTMQNLIKKYQDAIGVSNSDREKAGGVYG